MDSVDIVLLSGVGGNDMEKIKKCIPYVLLAIMIVVQFYFAHSNQIAVPFGKH